MVYLTVSMISAGEESRTFGKIAEAVLSLMAVFKLKFCRRVPRWLVKEVGRSSGYTPRDSTWEVWQSLGVCLFHGNPRGSEAGGPQEMPGEILVSRAAGGHRMGGLSLPGSLLYAWLCSVSLGAVDRE